MLAAAGISFMMFGTATFWTIVIIAASGTILSYLIGDLLILPRYGNIIASIIDGILGGAVAWMIVSLMPITYYYMTSVYIFAVIVAVAEFFYHMYLLSAHVVEPKKSDSGFYKKQKLNYNTEIGNELYPYASKDNNESSGRMGTINSGYNKSINKQDNNGGSVRNNKK